MTFSVSISVTGATAKSAAKAQIAQQVLGDKSAPFVPALQGVIDALPAATIGISGSISGSMPDPATGGSGSVSASLSVSVAAAA